MCQPSVMMFRSPRCAELMSRMGPGSRKRRIFARGKARFWYVLIPSPTYAIPAAPAQLAVLSDALLRRHGEGLLTRLVASGTNTNPWLTEAHDKIVMPGDLVGVDTDANGYEGYVIDVSRTFLCGDAPSPEQKEAYRVAYDCVNGMLDLVQPGLTFAEFAAKAPPPARGLPAPALPAQAPPGGAGGRGAGHPPPRRRPGPPPHPARP